MNLVRGGALSVAFFIFFSIVLLAGSGFADKGPGDCQALSVEDSVQLATANNPDLAAIQARYEALAAVPSQRSSLPDPVLALGALNLPVDTFDLDQENMTQLQVGLSQKFPFPGKLSLKEESATLEAGAALEEVGEARLQLAKKTRTNWWDLLYLGKSLEIVLANCE